MPATAILCEWQWSGGRRGKEFLKYEMKRELWESKKEPYEENLFGNKEKDHENKNSFSILFVLWCLNNTLCFYILDLLYTRPDTSRHSRAAHIFHGRFQGFFVTFMMWGSKGIKSIIFCPHYERLREIWGEITDHQHQCEAEGLPQRLSQTLGLSLTVHSLYSQFNGSNCMEWSLMFCLFFSNCINNTFLWPYNFLVIVCIHYFFYQVLLLKNS